MKWKLVGNTHMCEKRKELERKEKARQELELGSTPSPPPFVNNQEENVVIISKSELLKKKKPAPLPADGQWKKVNYKIKYQSKFYIICLY